METKIVIYQTNKWTWTKIVSRINQIQVLSERYMKHNVTPLNGKNEPLAFRKLMFGNCLQEKTLECYPAWPTPTSSDKQLGLLPHPTDGNETCTVCFSDSSSSVKNGSSSSSSTPKGPCTDNLWAMNLDKSGTHDGSRTECISVIQNNG